jgi:hypothetical protein
VLSFEAYQNLLPQENAWDALRPLDPVLEEDDPDPFERLPAVPREFNFDD